VFDLYLKLEYESFEFQSNMRALGFEVMPTGMGTGTKPVSSEPPRSGFCARLGCLKA